MMDKQAFGNGLSQTPLGSINYFRPKISVGLAKEFGIHPLIAHTQPAKMTFALSVKKAGILMIAKSMGLLKVMQAKRWPRIRRALTM